MIGGVAIAVPVAPAAIPGAAAAVEADPTAVAGPDGQAAATTAGNAPAAPSVAPTPPSEAAATTGNPAAVKPAAGGALPSPFAQLLDGNVRSTGSTAPLPVAADTGATPADAPARDRPAESADTAPPPLPEQLLALLALLAPAPAAAAPAAPPPATAVPVQSGAHPAMPPTATPPQATAASLPLPGPATTAPPGPANPIAPAPTLPDGAGPGRHQDGPELAGTFDVLLKGVAGSTTGDAATAATEPVPGVVLPPAAAPGASAARAPVVLPTPVMQPVDAGAGYGDELGNSVVWMAEQRIGRAELRVTPEHLGPIDVRLQLDGQHVRAEFTSTQPDVRHALEASLPRLRELLGQQGLTLAQADVGQRREDARPQAQAFPADAREPEADAPAGAPLSARLRIARGLLDEYA